MAFAQDLFARFRQTFVAYAGDEALMQAGVSAAANVIVTDGEVAGAEFETALTGVPLLGARMSFEDHGEHASFLLHGVLLAVAVASDLHPIQPRLYTGHSRG
jgi:hypothetical protein